MKNKIYLLSNILISFLTILILTFIFSMNNAYSHKINVNGKLTEHEPPFCKLPEDRSWFEKMKCKNSTAQHKLCKLDAICAVIKIEKLEKAVKDLEAKIINQDPINCNSLAFSHVALNNASVYQKPSGNSKVIKKVKKGQKISFVGSTDKKGWVIVVPKDKICTVGYINEKNIGLSTGSATNTKSEAPKIKKGTNIEITYPEWKTKNKLIVLDQDGFFEIDGYVNKDLGVNKVIINYDGNDEEMILGSDGSFNVGLQIENNLDVRITSYKGKKQIGNVLTFKIEVE